MKTMNNKKDKLDELIGSRIAERGRKLKRLREMSGQKKSTVWVRLTPLAIAACLTVAVIIGTRQSQNEGMQDVCRAASPDIQQLIDNKEWDKAHALVLDEIRDADSTICHLEKEDTTDEEIAYELQYERQKMNDMKRLEKEISKKMK